MCPLLGVTRPEFGVTVALCTSCTVLDKLLSISHLCKAQQDCNDQTSEYNYP